MKRGNFIFLFLFLVLLISMPFQAVADEQTENLVSEIVESFDPDTMASDWAVQGSKFRTILYDDDGTTITEEWPKWAYVDGWPEALHGANWEENDYQVLAIQTKFDRKGYNYIEIIPVKTGENDEVEPNPLPLRGRVKIIDIWALGTQHDYYLEVHLRDANGVIHVLNMGSLNFEGWKNLKADIPTFIPQSSNYAPYFQGLELVKFMIWTTPNEKVDDFLIFIDQIKILTDDFVTKFDGDDLLRPEKINEINWNE